jgi:hypothetical protein
LNLILERLGHRGPKCEWVNDEGWSESTKFQAPNTK